MNKSLKIFLATVLSFGIYFILDDLFFYPVRRWLYEITGQLGISHIIAYAIFGIPLILGLVYMHNVNRIAESLGLNKPILKAMGFALLCTAPMLIGYALLFDFSTEITLNKILISVFAAAFFEEVYFRGFLYGQLYRYSKLGFLPSVAIGSFLFAFIHLYQSTDPATLAGIFLTTFLGAILFAWAYSEWKHNIWVPVFLHLFMNLFWMLFSAGDNAFGGLQANIFRLLSIILIIGLTVYSKKKKGIPLEINRNTVWLKKV